MRDGLKEKSVCVPATTPKTTSNNTWIKKITTWETPTAVAAAGPDTPARLRNLIFTATDPRVGGVTKVAKEAAS